MKPSLLKWQAEIDLFYKVNKSQFIYKPRDVFVLFHQLLKNHVVVFPNFHNAKQRFLN